MITFSRNLFIVCINLLLNTELSRAVPGGRSSSPKRFVKANLTALPAWVTDAYVAELLFKNSSYLDVTGLPIPDVSWVRKTWPIPTSARYEAKAKELTAKVNQTRMREFITTYSSYYNRLAGNALGRDAMYWIYSGLVSPLVKNYKQGKATVIEYEPIGGFKDEWHQQKTVIARIEGSDPELKKEIVIIGAHADSVSVHDTPCLTEECFTRRAPGADDNASGSSVLLEALRILVESGFVPKRTIEFHWYAAEEYGIRGSLVVAGNYNQRKENVVGMVCFDVCGYAPTPKLAETVAIQGFDVHPDLTKFVKILVEKYLNIKWIDKSICPWCYSDYVSWTYNGYPSAFPYETEVTPYIHSRFDTVETMNFDYLQEFAKLAVAYLVEYSEPAK